MVSANKPDDGSYDVTVGVTCAPDYGIHKLTFADQPVPDPIDLYAGGVSFRKVKLGEFKLKKGDNLLAVVRTAVLCGAPGHCAAGGRGSAPTTRSGCARSA